MGAEPASSCTLVGALAAGGADAAAPSIAKFLFGKESKDLTDAEKETVSSIAGMGGARLESFQDALLGAAEGSAAAKDAVASNPGCLPVTAATTPMPDWKQRAESYEK